MQIILEEYEIMEALEAFVRERITLASNQTIDINLKAGRGENGFTATLDIKTNKSSVAPTAPTPLMDVSAVLAEAFNAVSLIQEETKEVPAISTGEDRVEPESSVIEEAAAEPAPKKTAGIFANALKTEDPEAAEEAPAKTPNSIFNFKKTGA